MNTYLYAESKNSKVIIRKIIANSYNNCVDKIREHFMNMFEDLEPQDSYDELRDVLALDYNIALSDIKEIDEFL